MLRWIVESKVRDLRIADRTLDLAFKVECDVLFEKANSIHDSAVLYNRIVNMVYGNGWMTYLRPQRLLDCEDPCPPPSLVYTDSLYVFDLYFVEGPVGWDLEPDLELMLVNEVRGHNLVHGCSHFDREILVHELGSDLGALHVRQLCANYDGREVERCIRRNAG